MRYVFYLVLAFVGSAALAEEFTREQARYREQLSSSEAWEIAQLPGPLHLNLLTTSNFYSGVAESLAKHEGTLSLDGLTTLTTLKEAEALAKHEGKLHLNGLTKLGDLEARALAKHQGDLYLNGVTRLSAAEAKELARLDGALYLNGLKTLEYEAAEGLAKHKGALWLNGLLSIDRGVGDALAKHEGKLWLDGLTGTLSEKDFAALRKNPNINLPVKMDR